MKIIKLNTYEFIEVTDNKKFNLIWHTCPFNLAFRCKKPIKGSGIYFISINNEVVYIGKYQSQTGNIITDRWLKHLTTISARGYRIGFRSESIIGKLNAVAGNAEFKDILNIAHRKNLRYKLFRDTGHTTSVNRVRFISDNWSVFKKLKCDDFLDLFELHFIALQSKGNVKKINGLISGLELSVLQQVKPVCNKEFDYKINSKNRRQNRPRLITKIIMREIDSIPGLTANYHVVLKSISKHDE
jgi:hypothetical protein